ncbi:MAG: hypothetical protein ACK4WC_07240 [Rubrimonas sp.]
MSRLSPIAAILRLLLALALVMPHGAHVGGRDGITLVICGAEGSYEIALGEAAPADPVHLHDCCILCGVASCGQIPADAVRAVVVSAVPPSRSSVVDGRHPRGLPAPRGPPFMV